MINILQIVPIAILTIILGLTLHALPAILTLPRGQRPGTKKLTIAQAAGQLRYSGKKGSQLVGSARELVASRMTYCRRNGFDPYNRAFERGYGYCQQHAYALANLLKKLGFEADVVHAFRNRFRDGREISHAWVRVIMDGEARYIDSLYYDSKAGELTFTPVSKVLEYTPLFRLLAGWGSTVVNAHRYYVTGKD